MGNYGPPGHGDPEPWRGRRSDESYAPSAGPPGRGGWNAPQPYGADPHPPAAPGYDTEPYPHGDPGYGTEPYPHGDPGHGTEPYRQADPVPGYAADRAPGYDTDPCRGAEQPYATWRAAGASPPAYPGDPQPPRGRGPVVAALAAVLVLVLGGAAAVLYLLGPDDEATQASAPSEPAAAASSAVAGTPAPGEPAPGPSADARFVKAGQCVRNDGPLGGKPKLSISECAPESYEVLRRIDGATSGEKDAAAKCAEVEGYTNWYFFDSELDTLDFVLCLKQR